MSIIWVIYKNLHRLSWRSGTFFDSIEELSRAQNDWKWLRSRGAQYLSHSRSKIFADSFGYIHWMDFILIEWWWFRLTVAVVWMATEIQLWCWKVSIWRCTVVKWWPFLDRKAVAKRLCSMWSRVVRPIQRVAKCYWMDQRWQSQCSNIDVAMWRMQLTSFMDSLCRKRCTTRRRWYEWIHITLSKQPFKFECSWLSVEWLFKRF